MAGSRHAKHALVEIIGVAGTGKSTVTKMLIEETGYTRSPFISARELAQLPLFLRSLRRLVPLVTRNLTEWPKMTWADFKLMVYVTSWDRRLQRQPGTGILILDQGPLYALVRLKAKGLGIASSPAFQEWWSEMLEKWLNEISVVIWLDAADEVLMGRINQRAQDHDLKDVPLKTGEEFLERYRSLFHGIASKIDRNGHPGIHRIDTGHLRLVEVAKAVAAAISQEQSAPREPGT